MHCVKTVSFEEAEVKKEHQSITNRDLTIFRKKKLFVLAELQSWDCTLYIQKKTGVNKV